MATRHCLALDLKDNPALIEKYKQYHQVGNVWPEIIDSIKASGIEQAEIYLVGNRLFMILEVSDDFSFEAKQAADLSNPKVVEWETLMWTFQQQLPFATSEEKWLLMDKIFTL
ncbi:L-rhamnose mutarotase [Colwellia sp. MSW7]|uniref:L-rhamnose mutarotase n=1 Tax=Colwellia maritima TaxID=2912588 RepID=A0ABS9X165_9GAMM|nr:L-rhamnose mutarotase [Colwellia maritima]